jgi:hypothetical protein
MAPYTWSVTTGELPAGLELDGATGQISGTPTSPGTAALAVRATDSGNPRQSADAPLELTVAPSTLAITGVTPNELPAGAGNIALTVTGRRFLPTAQLRASDRRIAFSAPTVQNATTLTTQVTVPSDVPAGAYDVSIDEGADSATCHDCLVILKATPDQPAAPLPAPQKPSVDPGPPVSPPLVSPPPVSPPPVTAATTARLELVREPAVIRGDRVRFTIRCVGGECRGEATGAAVTTARFTLASGTTRKVTVRLNGKGRAQLKRTGRLRVRLTISQRASGRQLHTISQRTITIRARRARHR